ncbi:SDR family NAD(P)-dependent oxidoreductase [Komagataeibacter sp. FXV2]|nr:SDR family NAD(P)-dependent oxidoreductase [Komagataeibacter sp. FXV2]
MTAPFPPDSTQHPLAVITGGAGGIGRLVIDGLLAAGYHVIALTRQGSVPTLEHSPDVTNIRCDLGDPQALGSAADRIRTLGAPVRALIHCAGVIVPQAATSLDDRSVREQVTVNLQAPIMLTTRLLDLVPRGGHVVFVNSMAAIVPLGGSSVYAATKFGLRGFALSLREEVRARGIHVSSIFPGAVDTPMLQKEMQNGGSALNFVTLPVPPQQIATLILRSLRQRGRDVFVPSSDGVFGQLLLIFPALWQKLLPVMLWMGEKGRRKYLRERHDETGTTSS